MIKWTDFSDISIPSWVIDHQSEFQSRLYVDDEARMDFVLTAALTNVKLTGAAPLAAAVFMEDGKLILLGVDAVGIGGHEMTNEWPHQFVCAVNHEDLLMALELPNTLMPESGWINILKSRGIVVRSAVARERGKKILQHYTAILSQT